MSTEVQEYAVQIAGGAMHIRPTAEEGAGAAWIAAHQEHHGPVYTRTVIVVEDWHEVPPASSPGEQLSAPA
jgi:hypothetical protein